MRNLAGLAVVGAALMMASQACGSSDAKKKVIAPQGGGEGGEAGGPGMTGGGVGAAGEPAMMTGAGTGAGGAGGAPGAAGDSGSAGEASLAGAAGAPSECPCSNEHGASVCENALCKITSCDDGYGDCNGDAKDGCETSLVDNDLHCGACASDCIAVGSTCASNSCGDIPMQQGVTLGIGNGPFNDHAFAFSPDVGIANMTKTNSVVQLFPLDGSPGKVIWDSTNGASGNETLVIDGQEIFWAQRGTPNVVRKKAASAASAALPTDVFYPEDMPVYLRRQGDYFYWISGDFGEPGYIYRRLRTAAQDDPGTRIMDIAQGSATTITGFAVTTDAIYWVTSDDSNAETLDNDVRSVPLTGGVPSSIPKVVGATDASIKDFGNFTIIPNLTASGDTLYFARTIGDSTLNGIYRYKQGDAAPTKVAEAENVTTFALSDTHAYYGLLNQQGIWRAPLSGGQGVQVGKDYQSTIVGADDKFAYVAFVNQPSRFYKLYR